MQNDTNDGRPVVGFIGLGTMGGPMSSNIAKGGYELRLFDIDVARASAVAADIGATAVDEITGLESCDVIVTMLPTSAIVRATLLDDEGACASHCGRARSSQT